MRSGTKGTYFDRTLNLNADLFRYSLQELPDPDFSPPSRARKSQPAPAALIRRQGGKPRAWKISSDWLATPLTRLRLSAAYIDAGNS